MDKKTKMKEEKASGIWKKVLGICLAVIMVIGMTMPAWAQIDAESKGSNKVTSDESRWTASAYRVIDVNFVFLVWCRPAGGYFSFMTEISV